MRTKAVFGVPKFPRRHAEFSDRFHARESGFGFRAACFGNGPADIRERWRLVEYTIISGWISPVFGRRPSGSVRRFREKML